MNQTKKKWSRREIEAFGQTLIKGNRPLRMTRDRKTELLKVTLFTASQIVDVSELRQDMLVNHPAITEQRYEGDTIHFTAPYEFFQVWALLAYSRLVS